MGGEIKTKASATKVDDLEAAKVAAAQEIQTLTEARDAAIQEIKRLDAELQTKASATKVEDLEADQKAAEAEIITLNAAVDDASEELRRLDTELETKASKESFETLEADQKAAAAEITQLSSARVAASEKLSRLEQQLQQKAFATQVDDLEAAQSTAAAEIRTLTSARDAASEELTRLDAEIKKKASETKVLALETSTAGDIQKLTEAKDAAIENLKRLDAELRTRASAKTVEGAIAKEQKERGEAISALEGKISGETQARIGAIESADDALRDATSKLNAAIVQEEQTRFQQVQRLEMLLEGKANVKALEDLERRIATKEEALQRLQETAAQLQSDLDTERVARTSGDQSLEIRIGAKEVEFRKVQEKLISLQREIDEEKQALAREGSMRVEALKDLEAQISAELHKKASAKKVDHREELTGKAAQEIQTLTRAKDDIADEIARLKNEIITKASATTVLDPETFIEKASATTVLDSEIQSLMSWTQDNEDQFSEAQGSTPEEDWATSSVDDDHDPDEFGTHYDNAIRDVKGKSSGVSSSDDNQQQNRKRVTKKALRLFERMTYEGLTSRLEYFHDLLRGQLSVFQQLRIGQAQELSRVAAELSAHQSKTNAARARAAKGKLHFLFRMN